MDRTSGIRIVSFSLLAAVAIALGPPSEAAAQTASAPPKNLTLAGVSSGTVAPKGLGFGSLSYSSETDDGAGPEALTVGLGAGFGDAESGLGIQISAYATTEAGESDGVGAFALKAAHRLGFTRVPAYVSVTAGNLGRWGDDFDDPTGTVALTTFHSFTTAAGEVFPVAFSVGAGSAIEESGNAPGAFIGAGIGLTEQFGASAAWVGDSATFGLDFRPSASVPYSITAAVSDAFNDLDRRRVTVSVSFFVEDLFGR